MNILFPCIHQLIRIFTNQAQTYKTSKSDQIYSLETNCSESSPRTSDDDNSMLYQFQNKNNQQVYVPFQSDTLNQTRNLQIHNCQKSMFVILPSLENAIIDHCSDSYIFIGPCQSTVFIRNCHNMKIRALCQQLRLEDSCNIEVEAIVGVQPVLENSSKINLYSLSCCLPAQIVQNAENAGISWVQNQIYEAYDFTPKKNINFHNQYRSIQLTNQWKKVFKDLNIQWKNKCIQLPYCLPIKHCMMAKTYNHSYLTSKTDVMMIYSKMQQNQLLNKLNQYCLTDSLHLITKVNCERGIQTLRNTQYQENVNMVVCFWIVKVSDYGVEKYLRQLGIGICRDDQIIRSLLKVS